MARESLGDKVDGNAEQLRLAIALAVIATAIGAYTLDNNTYSLAIILQAFTVIPAILLGVYVLFTAAYLKYKSPAELSALSVPEKIRRGCYDIGVNQFWVMFLIFTLIFFASLFGWDGDMKKVFDFCPSFIVSFVVLLILVLVLVFMAEGEKTRKSIKKHKLNLSWRSR